MRRAMVLGSLVDTGYGDTVNKRFKRLQQELLLDDGAFTRMN